MLLEPLDLVGHTPLVELRRLQPKPGVRLFAKLESRNPSGSIKDRVALALVEQAERAGLIGPGSSIVEASSGNTGIALAMVARRKDLKLHIVLPTNVAPSIVDVLHAYGVETVHCDRCRDMAEAMGLAERMAERNGWHPVGQFTSEGNPLVHYQTTGAEILEDLPRVDVFIAGIGTGGTIMGVGRRLKEADPSTRLVGVEPRLGDRLQGLRPLSDGFRPPLLDLGLLDGRRMVGNPEALAAAKRIMEVEGISAGVSAGAAYVAARREAERLEQGNIVMLFADGAEKYLPARPWEAALAGEGRLDDLHLW